MNCVCCLGYEGNILPFVDEEKWRHVQQFGQTWINLQRPKQLLDVALKNQPVWEKSFEEIKSKYGYHPKCRSNFTNAAKLKIAKDQSENVVLV